LREIIKKIKIIKIIFISIIAALLILLLTALLTSCCNVGYFIDKLNELRNKTTASSDNTTSDTQDLSTSEQNTSDSAKDTNTTSSTSSFTSDQNSDTSSNTTAEKAEGKSINFIIDYNFDILGKTSMIDFITLIPGDYEDRQKISGIDYSIHPTRIFSYGPNKYAEFIISNPLSDFELEISAQLEIYDYDLDRAMSLNKYQTPGEDLSKYLAGEKYIEVNDPAVQNIDLINIETEYSLDYVEMLYDYVMEHMNYLGYNPDDIGAVEALKNKGGDCTDYSDTFVTLCRASGFPARSIEGYPIDAEDFNIGHSWSEVFISDFGWVPFDPTYDDTNGSSQDTTYENLKNVYIYMSFIRNDTTLNNFHYYSYSHEGDDLKVDKSIFINMN
jgi:transglutaminase/protease-like cytokinesis protein 3